MLEEALNYRCISVWEYEIPYPHLLDAPQWQNPMTRLTFSFLEFVIIIIIIISSSN
ncbi:hypothetical protein BD408DRAFT_416372 [Parasitella parasitica]|nr:hypothetical protein BD408DRAFT_416372 [Parasitella parasitica]